MKSNDAVKFNELLNSLVEHISMLLEETAEEGLQKGLSQEEVLSLCAEGLDNAADTWSEEGQDVVKEIDESFA